MSRFTLAEGKPRIHVGAGPIADMDSPSLTEIAALTNLSGFLAKDGFASGESGTRVPASPANERVSLELSGSVSYTVSMAFFRDDTLDSAWDAFDTGDTVYVVFCRKGGSGTAGAIAAGDEVEVYYGEILDKSNNDLAENTTARFTSGLSTKAAPSLSAIVNGS
jgi:hypothetical protein